MMRPEISDNVHYVSAGSKDDTYPGTCRAATVTEIGDTELGEVGLMVINPEGIYFRPLASNGVVFDQDKAPLTWHWGREECSK